MIRYPLAMRYKQRHTTNISDIPAENEEHTASMKSIDESVGDQTQTEAAAAGDDDDDNQPSNAVVDDTSAAVTGESALYSLRTFYTRKDDYHCLMTVTIFFICF